jgi:hypothetical protein
MLDLIVRRIEGTREQGAEENVWPFDEQEAGEQ